MKSWRLLFAAEQRFVRLLSGVTLLSITLGVFFLIVVLSVMRGFQSELNERWIGLNAHLTVSGLPFEAPATKSFLATIQSWPEIASIQKYLAGEVIVESQTGPEKITVAAKLKGFDQLPPDFLSRMQLYPPWERDWSLIGGDELLATLNTHPDFSQPVTLLYPFGEVGPTGDWIPTQEKILISHAFHTGLYAWDAYTVVVPLAKAQALLGEFASPSLQIRLHHLKDLPKMEKRIQAIAPKGMTIESFAKQNAKLFAALQLERLAMTLLLSLFLLIASFSIGGLLLMFLSAKQRDLAILRAIGLTPANTKKFYLALGGWLGGLGGLLGTMLGLFACWLLIRFPIQLPPTYYLDYLPVKLEGLPILGIFLLSLALALGASYYPAHLASKLPILPMLREE